MRSICMLIEVVVPLDPLYFTSMRTFLNLSILFRDMTEKDSERQWILSDKFFSANKFSVQTLFHFCRAISLQAVISMLQYDEKCRHGNPACRLLSSVLSRQRFFFLFSIMIISHAWNQLKWHFEILFNVNTHWSRVYWRRRKKIIIF